MKLGKNFVLKFFLMLSILKKRKRFGIKKTSTNIKQVCKKFRISVKVGDNTLKSQIIFAYNCHF